MGGAGSGPPGIAVAGLDRDELTRVWGDRIFPSLSAGVRSVYRTGRWLSVDGGEAVFGFEHPQFLQRGADRRAEVEAALRSHFGTRVGLKLVLAETAAMATAMATAMAGPRPTGPPEAPAYEGPLPDRPPEDDEEISAAEFAELEAARGEPASAEARLLQAFPGSEEVTR
jgi:hypothetical protein